MVKESGGEEEATPSNTESGKNIREIAGTLVYDLGKVTLGASGELPALKLTFKNTADTSSDLPMHQGTQQTTWGKICLTSSSESANFKLSWDARAGRLEQQGETSTVTITPKASAAGRYKL